MVNHKDENKLNNCVENLEWCDATHNRNYGTLPERSSKAMINNPKKSYTIGQYDLNDNLLAIYTSGAEVERLFGYNRSNLYKCAKGVYNTAYGYKWKYMSSLQGSDLKEITE